MSLLDDVSIVVTPNGYKAGVLYSAIPSSGAADLEVVRASAATRVDENGLVNYAEIIGDEEVTNGDFATDSDWTKGSAWSISGNNANFDDSTNSGITQSIVFTTSKTYKVDFEITSGSGTIAFLSSNGVTTYVSYATYGAGTYSVEFNYTTGSGFGIFGSSFLGGAFSISNISVKEVTRDNVPRIDYSGGGCPHILAEPQRTNEVTYSSDFTQWSKEATVTLTPNYSTSPDGTNNATRVQLDTNDSLYLSSLGSSKTFSIYVKGVAGETIRISNGVATMFTLTGNYDRLEVFDTTGSSSIISINTYSSATARDVQIFGAQLEEGSYATSYIPTDGGTVTRVQDQFSRDGIASLINSEQGVLFVEMAALADDGTHRFITLDDGTNFQNGSVNLSYDTSSNQILYTYKTSSNTTQSSLNYSLSDSTAFNKIAVVWKVNKFELWVDGVMRQDDSSGIVNSAGTFTKIAFDRDGSIPLFGKVKQLQVYKTALTDTQLTALTS